MVTIYTTNSCASCKKAIKWLQDNNVKFKEINMFKQPLSRADIVKILSNSENGFEDIISTRSKVILESGVDIESMKFNELVDFIIMNPSILRRPIIIDDKKFQVGYDDDEITVFSPAELRKQIVNAVCKDESETCEYINVLKEQLGSEKKNA